jgi:hypothetical protein
MLTMYDPDGGTLSYCGECWWSDKWDPFFYGQDYDFNKPFFTQYLELLRKVPHQNLSVLYNTLVDSNFTNMNHELKNCYYLFNSDYDENCSYSEEVERSKDCLDTTMIEDTQLAYESFNCGKCYQIYYSIGCENSHNIWFSKNLSGCANCFGCINLRNQQYCIFNEKFSKDDYQNKIAEFKLDSYAVVQDMKNKVTEFWLKFPNKYMYGLKNLDSSGDYIFNSKNVKNSFIVIGSEYCKYCMWLIVKGNKDCYDFTQYGENCQLVYESLVCGININNIIGCKTVLESRNVAYSMFCYSNNSNLFGCFGLRNKQYCILNKQYSKEEYEALAPNIIKHMSEVPYRDRMGRTYNYGDFFPTELSPFSYNETSAQEFFPMKKQDAETSGFSWKDLKDKNYKVTIKSQNLPDSILNVKEDIVSQIIECAHAGECDEQCATAFRIIPQELHFYKSQNLPLPRLCPNCRHYDRVKNRNPVKLWPRQCMCGSTSSPQAIKNTAKHFHGDKPCTNEFDTSYAPERPEIVYCEQCYQQEVV